MRDILDLLRCFWPLRLHHWHVTDIHNIHHPDIPLVGQRRECEYCCRVEWRDTVWRDVDVDITFFNEWREV